MQRVPDRINFDPFPWHSMAIWMLTQMKRWGQVQGDVDYAGIAQQVYLALDAGRAMRAQELPVPDSTMRTHRIFGREFDPAQPEAISTASPSAGPDDRDRLTPGASAAHPSRSWR